MESIHFLSNNVNDNHFYLCCQWYFNIYCCLFKSPTRIKLSLIKRSSYSLWNMSFSLLYYLTIYNIKKVSTRCVIKKMVNLGQLTTITLSKKRLLLWLREPIYCESELTTLLFILKWSWLREPIYYESELTTLLFKLKWSWFRNTRWFFCKNT